MPLPFFPPFSSEVLTLEDIFSEIVGNKIQFSLELLPNPVPIQPQLAQQDQRDGHLCFPVGQDAGRNSREVVACVTGVSDAEQGDKRWKGL